MRRACSQLTFSSVLAVLIMCIAATIAATIILLPGKGVVTYGKDIPFTERRILRDVGDMLIKHPLNFQQSGVYSWEIVGFKDWLGGGFDEVQIKKLPDDSLRYLNADGRGTRSPIVFLSRERVVVTYASLSSVVLRELHLCQLCSSRVFRGQLASELGANAVLTEYDPKSGLMQRVTGAHFAEIVLLEKSPGRGW